MTLLFGKIYFEGVSKLTSSYHSVRMKGGCDLRAKSHFAPRDNSGKPLFVRRHFT